MILDGKKVSEKIYENLEKEIGGLKAQGIRPFLAVILVGEDPASLLYTRKKEEKAESLGISFKLYHFPAMALQSDILKTIEELNQNKNIHGIMVQLPLPKNFDADKIIEAIAPEKNIEKVSPAALAILEILKFYKIDINHKKIVLVGHGKLVGEPLEKILTAQGYEPLVCDSETSDLKPITLSADIIISAVGDPGLITADMVSSKAVIIDAGTAESGGKTVGDVDKAAYGKVAAYSPVPGGVGPVTVAVLMKNLVESTKNLTKD